MKHLFALASVIVLAFSVTSYAQCDPREPGIYAIVGDESIPLTYVRGSSPVKVGFRIPKVRYKGARSTVTASDTFVLVVDLEQSLFVESDPFVKTLTPEDMVVIPLSVNPEKKCREFNAEMLFQGQEVWKIFINGGMKIDWEQISDNSFKIRIHGLVGGEYGIAFNKYNDTSYEYGIFGFTVPKGYLEGRLTESTPADGDSTEAGIKTVSD